jgi:hypothetical protein
MKRWIGAGLLAATLMVTGCVSNAGYSRNYRYDRYRNYRDGHYPDNDDRHRDQDRRDDRENWR